MRRREICIAALALCVATAWCGASWAQEPAAAQEAAASPGRQRREQREESARPSLWQRVTTGTKNLFRSPLSRPNDIPPLSEDEAQVEPARPKTRSAPSDVKKASHQSVPQGERAARPTATAAKPKTPAAKTKTPAAAAGKPSAPKSGGLFSRQPAKPRKTLTEYMAEERP